MTAMAAKIRIGIVGYGNIGRGVEGAVRKNPDMELVAIFTRRDPGTLVTASPDVPVYHTDEAQQHAADVDVAILCGGSAMDLPEQGPRLAGIFNTVDSYDTHAKIPRYFEAIDAVAKRKGTTCVISTGWDPGLFSLLRVIEEAVLPEGKSYTFWGPGVSQGHSDAARRVPGVLDARQYTIPRQQAIERVRAGENPELTVRQKHLRECYVVCAPGADQERIRRQIVEMPDYFCDYCLLYTSPSPRDRG